MIVVRFREDRDDIIEIEDHFDRLGAFCSWRDIDSNEDLIRESVELLALEDGGLNECSAEVLDILELLDSRAVEVRVEEVILLRCPRVLVVRNQREFHLVQEIRVLLDILFEVILSRQQLVQRFVVGIHLPAQLVLEEIFIRFDETAEFQLPPNDLAAPTQVDLHEQFP